MLEWMCFEAKAYQPMRLFEALSFSWSCLLNLELILKQCLTFECLLKQPCINSTLASSKPCIHTFTFSPFLMMTILIKWILFGIIKNCKIHILPLFYDDNHYQVNSFRHHQNLKPAWFIFSLFLMMTTICRLGVKRISIWVILLPLYFAMISYMKQLKIS